MTTDLRVGALIRAARRRRGWRQRDLAAEAHVSQTAVSFVERGQLGRFGLSTLRAVGSAVEVDLPLAPRFRGAEGDRLLDARHAALVEAVVTRLVAVGWQVEVEHTFNHFGERGSVDVLGWREDVQALLLIEVKSEIVDVQQLLRSMATKRRLVPELVDRARGWRPARVANVLVLPEERGRRASVDRLRGVFDASLPARTVAIRRWLSEPTADLAGIWFLQVISQATGKRGLQPPRRVRRARPHAAERYPGVVQGHERGARAKIVLCSNHNAVLAEKGG